MRFYKDLVDSEFQIVIHRMLTPFAATHGGYLNQDIFFGVDHFSYQFVLAPTKCVPIFSELSQFGYVMLDDVAAPVECASSGWSDSSHTSWRSSRGNPPIQAILRVHIMAVFSIPQ